MVLSYSLFFAISLLRTAHSSPLLGINIFGGSSSSPKPTEVSDATVSSTLVRPAQFSRVAYCSSSVVSSWSCGPPCASLGNNVKVLQVGGDNADIPMCNLDATSNPKPFSKLNVTFVDFIANDPDTGTIVVSHQGTNPDNILSLLDDVQFFLTDLNATRFTSSHGLGTQVHDGFQKTFEKTADGILAGVQSALATTGASKVLVTGHSLGAAIATLDAMMLTQDLDPSVDITTTVFALPRVGNQAWANFVDSQLGSSLSHITNQNDPVPVEPPRLLKFQHPSGEIHIKSVDANGNATAIVACPGQENGNCQDGNSLFHVDIDNHNGPYFDDISFGSAACPL